MSKIDDGKKLEQDVFRGQPDNVVVACVDYDGLLKFGDDIYIRYTWASERWRGAEWISKIKNSGYEPLTCLVRDNPKTALKEGGE